MSRWLALLVATVAIVLWQAVSQASAAPIPIPSVEISGGGLPHAVQLAPADAYTFQSRVNRPPHLVEEPDVTGASYTVTTAYWQNSFLPDKDKDESDDSKVAPDATYYPDGGYVLEQADGHDAWIVIDLRQRAVLDRYIRLAKQGAIGEEPHILQVMSASANDATLGVQIGDRVLTQDEAAKFWKLASALKPEAGDPDPNFTPAPAGPHTLWITMTYPEGQAVQLVNDTAAGTLIEPLGQTTYLVSSDWLAPVLGSYDAANIGYTLGASIEQQPPAGSKLWWPVMVGGGLLALGLAVWWQRRYGGRL